MAIVKPQVLVSQAFTRQPAALVQPLRACICGPNAQLHRFTAPLEKPDIHVGAYDRLAGGNYPWPAKTAGSIVDDATVKLFVADAQLLYFDDLIGDFVSGRGLIVPVSGKTNRIRATSINFKTNGVYPRSWLLLDRDVRIGDRVYIRGVADAGDNTPDINAFPFTFSTNTVDSDPGAGGIKFDSATYTSVVSVRVDNFSYDGTNVVAWLSALDPGTKITIYSQSDPTAWLQIQLTSVITASGYLKLSCTPSGDGGGVFPTTPGDAILAVSAPGVGSASCTEIELWTYVDGFASDVGTAVIKYALEDANNQTSTTAATTISQTAGADNCVAATASGSAYDGRPDGYISETYTIDVIASSVAGCNAARLRITSASGTDNVDELTPADFGSPTDIGTRGLTATFDTNGEVGCVATAAAAGVAANEFVVGQQWTVFVRQAFKKADAFSGGTYTGDVDDTYIVEVTEGGLWADFPKISVTTVKGLDFSGPTEVASDLTAIPIGNYGVTIEFDVTSGSASSEAIDDAPGASGALTGLRKGDKFYITVKSGTNGPIRTLILRHDIPDSIRTAADLDLRLFIVKDIQVTENKLSDPPNVNYTLETTQLVINSDITAYDSTWTASGVEQPLTVYGGELYIEYREWLSALSNTIGFAATIDDLNAIPGPLAVANPLKWAVFRALQNANGTEVGYIAVGDPTSLDSWTTLLGRVSGRQDIYNYVPLTTTRAVFDLFQAQANDESSPEAGNWKAMFVSMTIVDRKMLVGQSDADTQALTPTSLDGELVLATLIDDPGATGTQYTRVSVPAGNAGFITYGIRGGDSIRFLFTVDAFGTASYSEFVIDSVVSENTLLLLTGHTVPISVPQKMEIWRTHTKDEVTDNLIAAAESFADRRVCCVLPDVAGTGGLAQAGYHVCAALAGLVSAVLPQQPLTNVEIKGFDNLASRTRDFFTSSQLLRLEQAGIWIATQDRTGSPYTRHALTTDTSTLATQEESMRRNLDAMSYIFLAVLRPYIGRTNVTPALLQRLEYEVMRVIKALKTNIVSNDVGPQLIAGAIAVDRNGSPQLYVYPLSADRVVIVLNLVLPAPLNNVQLSLVV